MCGLLKSSKELLLYLNKKKITLGTEFKVQQIERFDNSFEIEVTPTKTLVLTYEVCKCLLVQKL